LQQRIRRVFLQPQRFYTYDEAAAVLDWLVEEVEVGAEEGKLEPDRTPEVWRIEWGAGGVRGGVWEQADVEAALAAELAEALPELLRLRKMEVVALERVAAREAKTVHSVVSAELLDFVSANAEWLSEAVPPHPAQGHPLPASGARGFVVRRRVREDGRRP
jgi:hypothetical protein